MSAGRRSGVTNRGEKKRSFGGFSPGPSLPGMTPYLVPQDKSEIR